MLIIFTREREKGGHGSSIKPLCLAEEGGKAQEGRHGGVINAHPPSLVWRALNPHTMLKWPHDCHTWFPCSIVPVKGFRSSCTPRVAAARCHVYMPPLRSVNSFVDIAAAFHGPPPPAGIHAVWTCCLLNTIGHPHLWALPAVSVGIKSPSALTGVTKYRDVTLGAYFKEQPAECLSWPFEDSASVPARRSLNTLKKTLLILLPSKERGDCINSTFIVCFLLLPRSRLMARPCHAVTWVFTKEWATFSNLG